MNKVDLNQVLDLLINEEREEASKLLHNWFVNVSKDIHESLMQEDDEVLEDERLQDIEDDKSDIESEEYFGEGDLDDESAEGGEEDADAEVGAEGDADADAEGGAEFGAPEAEEVPVEDRVEDLEATLAALKAQFAELMGGEAPADAGMDGAAEAPADEFGAEVPAEEGMAFESEESEDEDKLEESDKDEDEDKLEEGEETVFEDDDFVDLEESFELEPVADPKLNGGKEIGSDGKAVSVNDKSPIPQKKGPDRVGGKPVEIKAKEHKGYERETAPGVKTQGLLKNQVKNAKADLTGVSKEGDKSAMLNKKDGFGSDSPKSPIGAGAADLRGSDLKRK
jgi:hypothetical protein